MKRLMTKSICTELKQLDKIVNKMNIKHPKGYPKDIDIEQGLGLTLINSLNKLTDMLCTDKARLQNYVEVCEKLIKQKNIIIREYEKETEFRPRG
jgi:hypothetical protein|tara:strand:+ start:1046 stop:1330 length:285 start_codon:yes stop_codon:yes gene_type:complete